VKGLNAVIHERVSLGEFGEFRGHNTTPETPREKIMRTTLLMTLACALALLTGEDALAQQKPAGVPEDIARQLREIGPVVNPPPVYKLYAPLLAQQPTDGVKRTDDVAYGPDERNKLDLFEPAAASDKKRPIAIFFHGGGFIRGDKSDRSNIGYFFARNDVVALIPSYRLAPKHPWPAGAQDVIAAVAWAKANAAAHDADPSRIFVIGESAGAAHIAAAAFMKNVQGEAGFGAAGIVLMSGVYDFDLETRARAQFGIATPDPRNDAYFGVDPARLLEASTALHVDAPKLPVLLTYSALDPAQMQIEAGELFAALCRAHGACPQLRVFADHDHVSPASSFNTPDESVSGPILEFIRKGA
jgi:acetyl esterase